MYMKKYGVMLLSAVIATTFMASTVLAVPGGNKGQADKPAAQTETEVEVTATTDETGETVTSNVYGKGKKGYIGLQKAFENVKGTPAEARIAELLVQKYGIEVEISAELSVLADEFETEGDLESASLVQEEAVKADIRNIEMYKKLGKLYDKMDKKGIRTYVNGVHPKFDVPPVLKEGRVLVPFRAISEALEAEVVWNAEERTVTVTRGDTVVVITIDSLVALVNGEEVTLDVPGQIQSGRTIVPVRFLTEAFNAEVIWDQETTSVIIIEEDSTDAVEGETADDTDSEQAAE
jgi:hypothetical protein